jgi:PBP1b-binding outer membrane lipoprotein LpoB
MFKKSIYLIILLALLLSACATARQAEVPMVEEVYVEREVIAQEAAGGMAPAPAMDMAYSSSGSIASTSIERLVIKNASLSIAVDDPEASMERISALAEEMGGYVVSAYMYQTYLDSGAKVPQASISIRVLADNLDATLAAIKAETKQPIISENISSDDVTAAYVDLQSQLTNLEAAEEQLQAIMDDAVRTEDVLAVYSQLTYIRGQIETIRGQMKYYEDSARLSLVSVELIANEAVQPLTIGGWQPVGVAKDAVQALINTIKFLANAAIWIVIFVIPVLLLVVGPWALIIWAILRWRRKRKAARQASPPAATVE